MSKKLARILTLTVALVSARVALADEATLKDIQKTLGMVPTFLKTLPSDAIGGIWADFKGLQLNPATAIPGKYKELIGLAVASQVPCRYCIYAHTAFAKLNGASNEEVAEAVLTAAATRKFSTLLNGNQIDLADFKAEMGRIFAALGKAGPLSGPAPSDAAGAYKEMERAFGFVPSFLKTYPESAVAGAWSQFRSELGETAIPGKYKELVGLAVASQIPCSYCIVAHTEGAKAGGATPAELHEAVAMAALTRQLSTWLNGSMQDEAVFKREIDQLVAGARKQMAKK